MLSLKIDDKKKIQNSITLKVFKLIEAYYDELLRIHHLV